jgi:hypothetical protein
MNAHSETAQHAANLLRLTGFIDCLPFGSRHILA